MALLAIEGIDGAGKHTQTQRLLQRLEKEGYRVGILSFPRYGQTFMAESVAQYLNGAFGGLHDLPPQFPALLFAGDRLESKPLLTSMLATYDVVLVDRYVASNQAHQAARVEAAQRQAFLDWLDRLEHGVYGLPRADATVYLDLPVDAATELIARKKPRDYTDAAADLHEADAQYLADCRAVYHQLAAAHAEAWVRIDCLDEAGVLHSVDEIHELVWQRVITRLAAPAGG